MLVQLLVGAYLVETAAGRDVVELVIEEDPVDKSVGLGLEDIGPGIAQKFHHIGSEGGAVGLQGRRRRVTAARNRADAADQGAHDVRNGTGGGAGRGAIEPVPTADLDAELVAGHDLEGDAGTYLGAGRASVEAGYVIIGVGGRVRWIAGGKRGPRVVQHRIIQVLGCGVPRLHRRGRITVCLLLVGQHHARVAQVVL